MLFTRNMAAFAGGAVAALVASRMLPPLLAQVAGTTGAVDGGDPFAALERDHRAILGLLVEMEQAPGDAGAGRAQRLLRLKRRLAAHALAEEDVVYPLLDQPGEAAGRARQLYAEHAEMKMHLHALEHMPKGATAWAERASALRALIEKHVREEEEVEFPRLRAALDERSMRRLAGEVQREKALLL